MAEGSTPPLILASGSRTRRAMLEAAGVRFTVVPADLDEAAFRTGLRDGRPDADGATVAEALARAKAEAVSRRHPDAVVIGADQVLTLGTDIVEKAPTVEKVREQILRLRGRVHELHSAAAIAIGGTARWSHTDTATLAMRRFSVTFLDRYLAAVGDRACDSVGGYQLEGLGIQLFEEIDGDFFTILGLPLLALLEELRLREILDT